MRSNLFLPLLALWLQASLSAAQNAGGTPLPELPVERDSGAVGELPDAPASPDASDDPASDVENVSPAAGGRDAGLYRECLEMAGDDPRGAIDFAFAWQAEQSSLAAKHCAAIAYLALDRFSLAGERLAEIARDLRTGRNLPPHLQAGEPRAILLAQIYGQLGNARLLAHDTDAAYSAFSAGLAALPRAAAPIRVELLVDRARTLGADGDFEAARSDLEAARRLAPERGDIALYLASAYRALDNLDAALEAVTAAIEADGNGPAALLERGNIRRMRAEPVAARRDWEEIISRWPDSAAAEAAKANLSRLDEEASGAAKGG